MTRQDDEIQLQVSVAKIQKDIQYILQAIEKQQKDIDNLNEFLSRWKGAALVLIGLGGAGTWIIDHIIKLLPLSGH